MYEIVARVTSTDTYGIGADNEFATVVEAEQAIKGLIALGAARLELSPGRDLARLLRAAVEFRDRVRCPDCYSGAPDVPPHDHEAQSTWGAQLPEFAELSAAMDALEGVN